ncbi:hypothetical protein [Microbacterium gilvum]|uniref:Minor tail protein n=1 Tax=Microbacterium gilvum TaxID=1336204 RepID=A0ABP8ZQ22_9MICO
MTVEFILRSNTRNVTGIILETTGLSSAYKFASDPQGLGFAPVLRTWAESPAGGKVLKSSRLSSQEIVLPVEVTGTSRRDVERKLSDLAWILDAPDAELIAVYPADGADPASSRVLSVVWEGGLENLYVTAEGPNSVTVEIDLVAPTGYWVGDTKAEAGGTTHFRTLVANAGDLRAPVQIVWPDGVGTGASRGHRLYNPGGQVVSTFTLGPSSSYRELTYTPNIGWQFFGPDRVERPAEILSVTYGVSRFPWVPARAEAGYYINRDSAGGSQLWQCRIIERWRGVR